MSIRIFVTPKEADWVNLRSAPALGAAPLVGKLPRGARLELAEQGSPWHRCRVYVSAQVARVSDGQFVALIPAPGRAFVNIRLAPNAQDASTDVGDLKPNQRLEFIEQAGDWLVARVYISAAHTRLIVENDEAAVPVADAFSPPIGAPEQHAAWFANPTASRARWPGAWFDANPYGTHYQLWTNGPWAYHTGADLNLPRQGDVQVDFGKPCFAPAAGVVRAARKIKRGTFGKVLIIEHRLPEGERVWSRLAHLLDMQVAPGQIVVRGQEVGHVGDGEGRFPAHLHYDLARIDLGREWNPAPPGQPDPPDPAGDWPGDGEAGRLRVQNDYVDPREFTLTHRPPN